MQTEIIPPSGRQRDKKPMLKKRNGYFSSKSKWKVKSNNAVKSAISIPLQNPQAKYPLQESKTRVPPGGKRGQTPANCIDQIKRSCNTAQRNEQSPKDMEITPEANSIPQRQKMGIEKTRFAGSKRLRYSDRHNNGQAQSACHTVSG